MNPIRRLLNQYKYNRLYLDNIVIKYDAHRDTLASIFGIEIKEILPNTILLDDEVEIPYHRIRKIYYNDQLIYQNEK